MSTFDKVLRVLAVAVGLVLMALGLIGALLPTHLLGGLLVIEDGHVAAFGSHADLAPTLGETPVEDLSGTMGDSDLGGLVRINLSQKKPLLTIALKSSKLDFDDLGVVAVLAQLVPHAVIKLGGVQRHRL